MSFSRTNLTSIVNSVGYPGNLRLSRKMTRLAIKLGVVGMFRRIYIATFLAVFLTAAHSVLAQSGYQVITVTDPGTISGTVKWSGHQPASLTIPIDKDPEVCDPDSHKKRDLQRLVIGSEGGVANTVVFLKNMSSGKAMDIPEARRSLDQKRCEYEPHILIVPESNALQMKSSDPVLHTVHMDGAATFNLPFPFQNRVTTRNMPSAGLVNLKCNGGHVWMNAELLVVTHPYYAVTDEEGRFKLTGVPPGDYELMAWHEGWQLLRQEASFDVLTERRVARPVFSDPRTWEKKVTVSPNGTSVVNFTISEK